MERRKVFSVFAGALAALTSGGARAQWSEQEVRNGLQVVSTGDVNVDQIASGVQGIYIEGGEFVTEDGIYPGPDGRQIIVNEGQIVSTGDVTARQVATGTQTVTTVVYEGMQAEVCNPGDVLADPETGLLYYQASDCCYYLSPCCKSNKCRGGSCQ